MQFPLYGRVFDRFRAFQKLPEAVQQQAYSVAEALARGNVYSTQSTSLLSSAVGIKSDELLRFVLQKIDQSAVTAEMVVDGLVLGGALAYHKEDAETASIFKNFTTRANAVFVPTDNELAGRASECSVWSVRDGATQAGAVKRSAHLVGQKDAYAVVNEKLRGLFLFHDDGSFDLKARLDLVGAIAEFDTKLLHGIKVSNGTESLAIGLPTKDAQEAWLDAIINAGASYSEAFNVDWENARSIYELKDRDMAGNEVSLSQFRGRVLLVVNVASKCALAAAHYPELMTLDEKYRSQGLQILAFPCNQFAHLEPGTHEEIVAFARQYNCTFPFLEKHDVNGANARPVFTYLKAKLPGSFGKFVKWNFTKFLVDRNGRPFKRYGPKDLPFSFEADIKMLLAQPVSKEIAGDTVQQTAMPAETATKQHGSMATTEPYAGMEANQRGFAATTQSRHGMDANQQHGIMGAGAPQRGMETNQQHHGFAGTTESRHGMDANQQHGIMGAGAPQRGMETNQQHHGFAGTAGPNHGMEGSTGQGFADIAQPYQGSENVQHRGFTGAVTPHRGTDASQHHGFNEEVQPYPGSEATKSHAFTRTDQPHHGMEGSKHYEGTRTAEPYPDMETPDRQAFMESPQPQHGTHSKLQAFKEKLMPHHDTEGSSTQNAPTETSKPYALPENTYLAAP